MEPENDLDLLRWYLDTFDSGGGRLWCAGCGDEILHGPPHNEPEYLDDQGQYVCPFCAELYYPEINRIPPMTPGALYKGGNRSWVGPFFT